MKLIHSLFTVCFLSATLSATGAEPANLILNPGFELQEATGKLPTGWTSQRGTPALMSGGGHMGERYLRMVDDGPDTSLFFASQKILARPGGTYSAAAWMRTDDTGRPGVFINFYNDQGRRLHNVYARAKGPTEGWVRVEVEGTAPALTATVTVSLYSYQSDRGTFDFDDAELHVEGGEEPLSAPRVKPSIDEVVEIGSRRELFVDRFLIDGMEDARLVLNRPRDEGVVLKFDEPWEGLFCGYCTIVKIPTGFRAYYRWRCMQVVTY